MSLFNKDDRAGLYITVIFHLTVIIVLLLYQIDSTIRKEESFVLDFSKQEEIERRQQEEVFKEDISRKLDELIAAAHSSSAPIRNIATDASRAQLKDDRGTDAEQLYKDAERLAKDLKNGQKDAIEEDASDETVEMQHQQKPSQENQREYSGPSVLSYTLDGRKASHLPIPAYRCYGAGDVTVIITVNNAGQVAPMSAAEIAAEYGIRVYTIGVGKQGYAPYPVYDSWGNLRYQQAKVEIDEQTLTDIAAKTGGEYFRATDKGSLYEVYERINKLEKSRIETDEFVKYNELYGSYLLWALVLLLAEFVVRRLWLNTIP